jgi:hypothetical protein
MWLCLCVSDGVAPLVGVGCGVVRVGWAEGLFLGSMLGAH